MEATKVLGIFAKEPRPGRVKTRLGHETTPPWAAAVASAFLEDTLTRLAAMAAKRILVYAPAEAGTFFRGLAGTHYTLEPQEAGDLGRRMEAFLRRHIRQSAQRLILVGTDSPTLPVEFVDQAFDLLDLADVVLGPAMDGGYYLLGCGRRVPPIFSGISWGAAGVLQETLLRLADSSWRIALLPPWYDVDTLDDWRVLAGHVAAMRRAGVDPQVPATERLLHRLPGQDTV